MDCDRIFPTVYVGSYPQTSDDVQRLRADGITAVLNLQSDDDFHYLEIDWERLKADYFAAGIEFRRVPIQDFHDEDLREKLPEAVKELSDLLQDGHTVLVHCSGGVNRSPSVVISYLHWNEGWQLDDAERHVRQCRACNPVMEVIQLATRDRLQSEQNGLE